MPLEGEHTSYVADDGSEQKMYVQTPEMYLPFGLSSWENKKFNIDLSFNNPLEGNQKVFSDMLDAFDKKIVKDALDHSADWLKKKFKPKDLPILQEFYSSPVRRSKNDEGELDGKFPPTLRVKVYKNRDDTWVPEVFDSNKVQIAVEEGLVKKAKVKCLAQLQSVWVAGGNNFGVSWSLHQAKVLPGSQMGLKKGYNFIEDSDEDEDGSGSEAESD